MDVDDQVWDTMMNDTIEDDEEPHTETHMINFLPKGKKTIFITKSGAFVKFSALSNSLVSAVKLATKIDNYFTLKHKLITGYMHQLKCAKLDKKNERIIVPRFGIYEILNDKYNLNNTTTVSQIAEGDPPTNKFVWKGTQTDNQKIITDEIMSKYFTKERIALGSAGVILNLEAGQGKSFVAAYLITKIQRKTAIILHSTALIEQWAKVLRASLGDTVSIGYYYGVKKINGDIMIMIVDSASSNMFKIGNETLTPVEFYNRFGLIIVDECHVFANKMALKAMRSAQAPCMLGLSATPDEHPNGYDNAVWWSLGPILDSKKIRNFVSTADNFKAVVHRIMYYGPTNYTKIIINSATETVSFAETTNMLCMDKHRNQLVINCILEGLALNLSIFVFADRRAYLSELRDLLESQAPVNSEILDSAEDFVRIVGGAAPGDLERAEINSRVIFTTYQYMGTGKSVVKMNGLVLAHPRKSKMKQYINRIFRLGSDESITRHIWDICDMKLKASSQWHTRLEHYAAKKYEIVPKKIKYEDISVVIPDLIVRAPRPAVVKPVAKHKTHNPLIQKPKKLDPEKIASIVDSLISNIKKAT